jgi:hypothetical protein
MVVMNEETVKSLIILGAGVFIGVALFHLERWVKQKIVLRKINKSLRLKPERIIIGEIRDYDDLPDQGITTLHAVNTGSLNTFDRKHDGDDVGHTMIYGKTGSSRLSSFKNEADSCKLNFIRHDVGHTMDFGEMGSDKLTSVFRDEADKLGWKSVNDPFKFNTLSEGGRPLDIQLSKPEY